MQSAWHRVRITDQKKLSRLGKKGFIYSSLPRLLLLLLLLLYILVRGKRKKGSLNEDSKIDTFGMNYL